MNLDPSTTKYMIRAIVRADGVIEKPDVVGAVFGQTEGLLGTELDMRDLQKSARIGRIEVEIDNKKGKSEGVILIPSSLDKVETAIIAAAVESIDRVGPCKATIKVEKIDDVRFTRRTQIVGRAKELLHAMLESDASDSGALTDEVRSAVQVAEITAWGSEKLPAGPGVAGSDDIILVEGRNDVLNLLRCGIRNALSVEGTNVPKTVQEITKERITTIFIDGDRGGELIARELLASCEVDFVARAPQTREVEELPHKLVMKALNNRMPADQFADTYGISHKKSTKKAEAPAIIAVAPAGGAQAAEIIQVERPDSGRGPMGGGRGDRREGGREERRDDRRGGGRERGRGGDRRDDRREGPRDGPRPERREGGREGGREGPREGGREERRDDRPPRREEFREERPARNLPPDLASYRDILGSVSGSLKAVLLDKEGKEIARDIAVRELADTLKNAKEPIGAVVFDGVITQRLLDIASDRQIATVVGVKVGNVTKKPDTVQVVTKTELE